MSQKNSIKTSYAYSLLYQILLVVVPLITTPYVSRVLEADGVGIHSLTATNTSYFTLFGVLGLGTYGQLEIAKVKDDIKQRSKLFYEIMLTRIGTHILCIIGYFILIILSSKYKTMYMLQSILILASMLDITWFFQGVEEFKKIAIRNTIIKIFSVVLIFLLVKKKNDLFIYTCILSLTSLLCSITFYPVLKKYIIRVDLKSLKPSKHIKGSFIFFLPTIASVIMTSLDKTMIGIITKSEEENGYYAQAYKIETLCMSLFSSLNLVIRSRMAYLFNNKDKNTASDLLFKSLRFVSLIAFPIAFGTIAITSNFVPWFFGEGYEKVNILLPIFAFWLIFKSHSNCIMEQNLTACGRQKTATVIIWAGAILNVALNAVLISSYKSIGAAIASVGAEICIFILVFVKCKNDVSFIRFLTNAWKYFIAAVIMCGIVILTGKILYQNILSTVIQIGVGGIIYLVLLVALRDSLIISILNKKKI